MNDLTYIFFIYFRPFINLVGLVVIGWLLLRLIKKLREHFLISQMYQAKIKQFQKKYQLSDSELSLFHEMMETTKQLILRYEAATKVNVQLTAIEKQEFGLQSAKELFQEMFANPKELTQYGDFIYKKLPGIVDASEGVVKVQKAGLNTPEIQQSMTVMLDTIAVIAASITDDYEQMIAEDSADIALNKKLVEKIHGS